MQITDYKHSSYTYGKTMNKLSFPVTTFSWEQYEEFNEVYKWTLANCIEGRKTNSGGIAGGPWNRYHSFYIEIYKPNKSIELVVCDVKAGCYRFIVANKKNADNANMGGTKALKKVYSLAEEFNLLEELKKEAVSKEEGLQVKKEIESPIIRTMSESFKGREFEHVYHIDANSSYFSRICEYNPALKPLGEYLYNNRKSNNGLFKAVMTNSVGAMQSEYCVDVYGDHFRKPYQLAKLAKVAVNGTNEFIRYYLDQLYMNNFEPILVNTDGIWYKDRTNQNRSFTDSKEGYSLGMWKHDHKDVKLYVKSAGAYQYIENGKVKTVLRGSCALDLIKPDRDTWGWKEIKDQVPYIYRFKHGIGVIKEDD